MAGKFSSSSIGIGLFPRPTSVQRSAPGTRIAATPLHSGKEFSAFDLAVCRAISPPVHFDAGECLMQRLLEEPRDDDEVFAEPQPFWMAPLSPAPSSPPPAAAVLCAPPAAPLSAKERNKINCPSEARFNCQNRRARPSRNNRPPPRLRQPRLGLVFRNRPRRLRPRLRRPPDPLDLRLVIRFPPGSTLLIPSALVRHSNVPIRAHEQRSSITQYTAGSLFRWVRNGCKTDAAFQSSASAEEKKARAAEDARRWEEGVKMFSVVDDL
ncbi:hypothetical protein B0H13DRAFT_2305525 [Mycena leptocephala]|nr:hypothetical protein B0H13DRAFT_2305525 [Mycena leptocephala]